MNIVSLCYGHATDATSSTKLNAFAHTGGILEFPSSVLSRAAPGGVTNVGRNGVNGKWYSNILTHVDGVVLVIKQTDSFSGAIHRQGMIAVRLRVQGTGLHVVSKVCANQQPRRVTALACRGDLLDTQQFRNLLGSAWRDSYNYYMDEEEINECFDIQKVAPAIAREPQIEIIGTVTGESVAAIKRARVLKLPTNPKDEN